MKFGVILPNFGKEATRLGLVDTALAAESLGYDSAWLTDHIALPQADSARFGRIFESLTSAAYLAAATNRIRLGISALVLPQRNPVEVAKQAATVDALSGGRMMLAVGVGWSEGEYGNLGYNFHDRGRRMDEAIKVLRTLWRGGETFSFKGEYTSFEKAVFQPGPVQSGGPVLWVGGHHPNALRRAVMLADGWHPSGMSAERMGNMLQSVKKMIANRPFNVCNRLHVIFDAEMANGLHGSPGEIIAQLKEFQAAGMDYAILEFEAASQAGRERAMGRFMREVAPEFP